MRKAAKRLWLRLASVAVIAVGLVMVVAPAGAKLDPSTTATRAQAGPLVVWPLDLKSASVAQSGLNLKLSLRTSGGFSARSLAARAGRSLCFELHRAQGGAAVRRLCLKIKGDRAVIERENLDRSGLVTSSKSLNSTIKRPNPQTMTAEVEVSAAGLGRGKFRWQAVSNWSDSSGCSASGCVALLPKLPAVATIHDPIPAGCVASGASYRLDSRRRQKVVAISFDDGPSIYTPAMLATLKRHNAHATFFQVGNVMGGRSAVQRRILAEGNSIGDHSWSHPVLSGGGAFADSEISRTKARIVRQAGFTPCLFRAPYGAVSGNLISIARSHGMLTIQWDVDPTDWARPGAGAIASRVLAQTRPGSIILMHDGGGDRAQSVAAADTILKTLARRGYRVVTVEALLGLKSVYR